MASLIKTNNLSTPGGEGFALPTTYPSATVDLTSTSGGQLGYGSANPVTANLSTATGRVAERFCDKLRVNNAVSTVANATLNALPSDVTDASSIVRTHVDFSGVCFTGRALPHIQLLDASNNDIINGNYYCQMRYGESYGGSSGTYNNMESQFSPTQGIKMTYNQSVTGGSKTGEIFTKVQNEDNLAFMNGYITISQYNIEDGLDHNSMLIETNIMFNHVDSYNSSGRSTMVHKWAYLRGQNQTYTFQPYTQLKIYDTNSNSINEGMFVVYSHINVDK